ncbi:MAG: hypothetical protein ABIL37_05680 [candidate division WOR-3 bacterium]
MKIAIIGNSDNDFVFKLLNNLNFERTFAFSINKKTKFNEYSRRLGFNVIIVNPNLVNWEEELKRAIIDFEPDIILNFEFEKSLENFEVFSVKLVEGFIIVEFNGKIVFFGDNFNSFLDIAKSIKSSK